MVAVCDSSAAEWLEMTDLFDKHVDLMDSVKNSVSRVLTNQEMQHEMESCLQSQFEWYVDTMVDTIATNVHTTVTKAESDMICCVVSTE